MMALFNKKLAGQPNAGDSREKLASHVAEQLLKTQERIARQMNRLAHKVGQKNALALLGALMLCFGGYCLWLLFRAVN